jgi:hypothetical protein
VFQFRKNKSEAAPAPWQQESAQQRARAMSEAATDEQRRQEQQAKMLQQGGAADLAVRAPWGGPCATASLIRITTAASRKWLTSRLLLMPRLMWLVPLPVGVHMLLRSTTF